MDNRVYRQPPKRVLPAYTRPEKKKRFKKRYVLGKGHPKSFGRGVVADEARTSVELKSSLMGIENVNLKWPVELDYHETPVYKLILERVKKK